MLLFEEPLRAIQFAIVAGQQDESRALRRQLARHHQAEPARAAGDHDDPSAEVDGPPAARDPRGEHDRRDAGREPGDELLLTRHPVASARAVAIGTPKGPVAANATAHR